MNELYHYGVKGMRWGVRRYQNYDGTCTSAGKRHYNIGNISRERRSSNSNEQIKTWKKKDAYGSYQGHRLVGHGDHDQHYMRSLKSGINLYTSKKNIRLTSNLSSNEVQGFMKELYKNENNPQKIERLLRSKLGGVKFDYSDMSANVPSFEKVGQSPRSSQQRLLIRGGDNVIEIEAINGDVEPYGVWSYADYKMYVARPDDDI